MISQRYILIATGTISSIPANKKGEDNSTLGTDCKSTHYNQTVPQFVKGIKYGSKMNICDHYENSLIIKKT